jgi:hypothetical protein
MANSNKYAKWQEVGAKVNGNEEAGGGVSSEGHAISIPSDEGRSWIKGQSRTDHAHLGSLLMPVASLSVLPKSNCKSTRAVRKLVDAGGLVGL